MMEEKKGEYKILFVCLGNICRSPSAEAVMKKLVQDAGLDGRIKIDSPVLLGITQEKKPIRVCARMRPVGDIS